MKIYVGYIRVSTAKQGQHGVSLQEQQDAISRYATRQQLQISQWFEERETAAKRGRPIFNDMLKLLRHGKADGVLIHKIDRSARNMKDWAELGELIDQGIEVHFVNESLDLASRGGRLSADIQAVVAADYIRNLREETRKGFYGRLKQGFYPLPAPIGYLDRGKAKPKELDPVRAPLVRRAFELYATASWTIRELREEIFRIGLHSRHGGSKLSVMAVSAMLRNPFYIGLIRIATTDEVYQGVHAPLVRKSLFDRVQLVLNGKLHAKVQTHDFQFRRLLRCSRCGYAMVGELQKGHVYYRCHTIECRKTGVREEIVDAAFVKQMQMLCFNEEEHAAILRSVHELRQDFLAQWETELNSNRLRLGQLRERLERLTDAYIDRLIDRETFEKRKESLLNEEQALREKNTQPKEAVINRLSKFLELAGSMYSLYKTAIPEEKRVLLRILTSNRVMDDKSVVITLKKPFLEVASRNFSSDGGPYRDRLRTVSAFVRRLATWFIENPNESFDFEAIRLSHYTRADEDFETRDVAA